MLDKMLNFQRRRKRRRRRRESLKSTKTQVFESTCWQVPMVVLLNLSQRDKVSNIQPILMLVYVISQHLVAHSIETQVKRTCMKELGLHTVEINIQEIEAAMVDQMLALLMVLN